MQQNGVNGEGGLSVSVREDVVLMLLPELYFVHFAGVFYGC